MDPFTMVVVIVAVSVTGGVVTRFLKTRESAEARMGADVAARLAQMEERLRVLERLVTDRGFELRAELDALERDDG